MVVVGTTGSGKSTLASDLAHRLNIPHIELDALHWGPDWQTDAEVFARKVADGIAAETWIVDGNYESVRDPIWRRATHLLWLDYPLGLVLARVLRRSFARSLFGTRLWSGNREPWRAWLRGDHPLWWAWRTWATRRAAIERLLREPAYAHLAVTRLRRRGDKVPFA